MQMPLGNQIKASELASRLETLDVDEGIRVEGAEGKMFVNKNASGVFVMQSGSEFQHLDSARHVLCAIKSKLGSKYSAWAY